MTQKGSFRQLISERFAKHRLSYRQWRTLNKRIKRAQSPRRDWRPTAAAAGALLFGTVAFYVMEWGVPTSDALIHHKIADEVAANHLKLRPLDVKSDRFVEVRRFFDQLDFVPVQSSWWAQTSATLLGGRYCSIRGKEAAQLRFETPVGTVQTVYEAVYDEDLHRYLPNFRQGEKPLVMSVRGLKVYLWREHDLLFAAISE